MFCLELLGFLGAAWVAGLDEDRSEDSVEYIERW